MQIYADNAATTQMSDIAIEAMLPYMKEVYGNPSSLHSVGQEAAEHLMAARKKMAELLKAILFNLDGIKPAFRNFSKKTLDQ